MTFISLCKKNRVKLLLVLINEIARREDTPIAGGAAHMTHSLHRTLGGSSAGLEGEEDRYTVYVLLPSAVEHLLLSLHF
jgi:hypothetical protein